MVSVGRIMKAAGRLILDPKFQDTAASSIQAQMRLNMKNGLSKYTDLHKNIGNAFVRAENKTSKTPLWESIKKSCTTLPKDLQNTWKTSSGAWAKTKGIFGQLGKRMPIIGGALGVLFELPNIFSAFNDNGLWGGITETLKSGSRLAGGMAGAAIGQALIPIPFLGGLVGYFAGDWLVSKFTGKSHSEKKIEQQEQSAMTAQNPYGTLNNGVQGNVSSPQMTMTPQQLALLQQQLYSSANMNDDFMMNASGMNKLNYLG